MLHCRISIKLRTKNSLKIELEKKELKSKKKSKKRNYTNLAALPVINYKQTIITRKTNANCG